MIAPRVGLVTGAGGGLGRAIAVELARRGLDQLVLVDRAEQACEEAAQATTGAGASAVATLCIDVAEPAALAKAFDLALDRFGRLDVVHNNAGIVTPQPGWPEVPAEALAAVIATNLGGVVVGTRLALDAMTAGGSVVNTSSVTALAPFDLDPVYGATKAAIVSFTQACRSLAESHGVRVNAVLPGIIDTPMLLATGDSGEPAPWLQPLLGRIALLTPADVAVAAVDLALDAGKAGETVVVMNEGSG